MAMAVIVAGFVSNRNGTRFVDGKSDYIETDMDPFSIETQRIVAAYERRKRSVPRDPYSVYSPGDTLDFQELEREILAVLDREHFDLSGEKLILEVGCGTGIWLREFVKWGALPEHLIGIDLLPERIQRARKLCPYGVRLECGNAARLCFPNNCFDLVLQSTVFTSILDRSLRHAVAAEMLRVLKPNGFIIWYDLHWNNPRNPDVRGIRGVEIRELFSGCQVRLHRVTLAPPLGRFVARYSSLLYILLSRTKVLNTHYFGLIRKN
jgi:ubiquinone/menaquinone biosynthesis C-methylase UbiE